MEKKFEYRGDLAVTPLPEILATIERYRVPGSLSIESGSRHRCIYLDRGVVVFATSDEPEVRLGTYLIRHGTLPEDVVQNAEARLAGDGLRLGQILIRLELLDQATLDGAIEEQVRTILWGAFDWESGEVVFEVGSRRGDEAIRIDLPIAEVIVDGIRRARSVRRFIERHLRSERRRRRRSGREDIVVVREGVGRCRRGIERRRIGEQRHHFVRCPAGIERIDKRLDDADCAVKASRISPRFEIVRHGHMPMAEPGGLILI